MKLTFSVLRALEKTISLKEDRDDSILNNLREGAPQGLTGVPKRAAQENDAIPRVAPKWLKHDRHVSLVEFGGLSVGHLLGRRVGGRTRPGAPTWPSILLLYSC